MTTGARTPPREPGRQSCPGLRFSRSAARVPESALSFGLDNRKVLEDLLGYTPERIAELAEQGVLQ